MIPGRFMVAAFAFPVAPANVISNVGPGFFINVAGKLPVLSAGRAPVTAGRAFIRFQNVAVWIHFIRYGLLYLPRGNLLQVNIL